MDLVIKDEPYKIQIGNEVYAVDYPSFDEAQKIAKEFQSIDGDGEKSISMMKDWLIKLGLDAKFFELKIVKANHILAIWTGLNSVKK
jgi:hypothetical protein